jgi:2,4-dienoyl-CoA reductase-like NADH-dependent reductase (Old Yellow Enzyme family)
MVAHKIQKLNRLKTAADFAQTLSGLEQSHPEFSLKFDTELEPSTLKQPVVIMGKTVSNRFCVLPMEGWDAERNGAPTPRIVRRWQRFGESGAALIWGGEAVAVQPSGRANPHQLQLTAETAPAIANLRATLLAAAPEGTNPLVGLQLTHSGRFARPEGPPAPRTAYAHPLLDARVGADSSSVLSDDELDSIKASMVEVAKRAQDAGFDFVDVKACHGYLLHELLSAHTRVGRYGGSFENRTRFMLSIFERIAEECPGLGLASRISAFDWLPFRPGEDGSGVPEDWEGEYRFAFGGDGSGQGSDLSECSRLIGELESRGVKLICLSAGSPYYNPHIQRPAFYPPSDGYTPPEDPLIGVARQIEATAKLKAQHPTVMFVGSGYSYLQQWIPNVAHWAVRTGQTDFVGLGRSTLSYPHLPHDVLTGRPLESKLICRTFSDCTTAPRGGLPSGCYPLDEEYKRSPEAPQLLELKRRARR